MAPKGCRALVGVASLLFALGLAGRARAGDPAAAQALFDHAKQLKAQGRYSEACLQLQESQRLDPGVGTQFHLADCWQRLGRTASAWALFREVESEAQALGQIGRERVAHDRATALEPWLSRLVLLPQDHAQSPGVEVRRDGIEVGRGQWEIPVPVDPGPHSVSMNAPNKRPWERTVEVPSNGKIVTVILPSLGGLADIDPSAESPPRTQAPTLQRLPVGRDAIGVTAAMPVTAAENPVLENRGGFQRAAGWLFVGAGIVGLGAGAYFWIQWADDSQVADRHCHGGSCDAVGQSSRDDERTQTARAEASAGIGAAALLVGTILVATAPGPRLVVKTDARVHVAPLLGASQGLALYGSW
jgi:serine/threonine-protein kinase